MAALKTAGGLSLIGAVVAEFIAGATRQNTGLATRILDSSFRNDVPRLFAVLHFPSPLGTAVSPITGSLSNLAPGHRDGAELKREG